MTVPHRSTYTIFPGKDGLWHWRHRHVNGHITSDGGEGYASPSNARRAVRARLKAHGINIAGPGWRARIARDLGIWIVKEDS